MEDKYKHKIVTIPNVLSFFRLLLIPVILWLWPGIGGVTVTAIRQAFEAAGDTCVSADPIAFTSGINITIVPGAVLSCTGDKLMLS